MAKPCPSRSRCRTADSSAEESRQLMWTALPSGKVKCMISLGSGRSFWQDEFATVGLQRPRVSQVKQAALPQDWSQGHALVGLIRIAVLAAGGGSAVSAYGAAA